MFAVAVIAVFGVFGVARADAGENAIFRFAVVSDTHVSPEGGFNTAFIGVAKKLGAMGGELDFMINTGDLVDHLVLPWGASPDKYIGKGRLPIPAMEMYKSIVRANFSIPWYSTLGNHDFYWNVVWNPSVPRKKVERMLLDALSDTNSIPALYYSFEHKGFNMIVLDSTSVATNHAGTWVAGFDDKQMDWFESELKKGKPSIVFMHHYPGAPVELTKADVKEHVTPRTARFYEIGKKYSGAIRMIFVGHGEKFAADKLFGAPIYMTGNPTVAPGYHIVECDAAAGTCRIANADDIKYNKF